MLGEFTFCCSVFVVESAPIQIGVGTLAVNGKAGQHLNVGRNDKEEEWRAETWAAADQHHTHIYIYIGIWVYVFEYGCLWNEQESKSYPCDPKTIFEVLLVLVY